MSARQLKPDHALAYNDRGVAYVAKGDFERALRDPTKAIELKPDSSDAYSNRAVEFYSLKQYDKAQADVAKCKQLGGDLNPEFLKALAQATSQPG